MKKLSLPQPQWQHLLLLFICLVPFGKAHAQYYDFSADNDGKTIYYRIKGTNVSVVSGDSKYSGNITIPGTVTNEGVQYNVNEIAFGAFNECRTLSSISLPEGLKKIDQKAFNGCISLKSIVIPKSVISVGLWAFQDCTSLETVTLSNQLSEIEGGVFSGCSSLAKITIPNSVVYIGSLAFANCSKLANVTLSNSLTVIDEHGFHNCSSLTSISLPNSLTSLGASAFSMCSNLKSVILPNSLSSIGQFAFMLCGKIDEVKAYIENPFTIDDYAFDTEVKKAAKLYVPEGKTQAYRNTSGWNFQTIEEMSDGGSCNEDGQKENSLVVWAKDGSRVTFALSKKPKVTFTDTDFHITGDSIDVTYAIDNMACFTYEIVNETAIKDIQTEKVIFKLTGESLLFPALKVNSTVSIYSLNGTLVFKKTIQTAGEYSFPISNLNTGVYLVSVNGLTYKIVKR